jgi:hypothetical protein
VDGSGTKQTSFFSFEIVIFCAEAARFACENFWKHGLADRVGSEARVLGNGRVFSDDMDVVYIHPDWWKMKTLSIIVLRSSNWLSHGFQEISIISWFFSFVFRESPSDHCISSSR